MFFSKFLLAKCWGRASLVFATLASLAVVAFTGAAAQAQTVTKTFLNNNTFPAPGPSNTDLLQTSVFSINDLITIRADENGHTNGSGYGFGTSATLHDGFPGIAGPGGTSPDGADGGVVISGGSITYNLNTLTNTLGYNVTGINTYSGWRDTGRMEQRYTARYSLVGDASFLDIVATVSGPNPTGAVEQVAITGLTLTGVDAIQFDFAFPIVGQQNGGVGYKELDVFGTPTAAAAAVPEPTSVAIWSLIGLGLACYGYDRARRKK